MMGQEQKTVLERDLTDRIWSVVPPDVRREKRITWISVYNLVRKALSTVGCVDVEKLNDYFDVRVIDTNDRDTIYRSLVNELSKYACADNDKTVYDADAVRGMTINHIEEAINTCLRSTCTENDINSLVDLINANKEVLGPEYHRLMATVAKLRTPTKAESETKAEVKPEIKPVAKPEIKPETVTVESENWTTLIKPVRVRVIRGSGSWVNDIAQENWFNVIKPAKQEVLKPVKPVRRERRESKTEKPGLKARLFEVVAKLYEVVVA